MKRTMAVILAGGEGERLSILSGVRAKPAVPFAGKYRIIDFTLSNCVNSDITNVVVLTQYNPRSLNDHIGLGRPWDLDRNTGGVKLLQPYIARGRVAEWYRGTADAVLQNFNVIEHDAGDVILILAGDHIYKMDYQPFIQAHRRKRADVTIAVRRVPLAEATRMGILALDENNKVVEWQEKPKHPKSDLASMGVHVSIVMFDSVIRSGAVVDRSILDKEVVVGPGAIVGDGPDYDTPNKQEPGRLNTGITVVGKRAIIPRGSRIGRNVKIAGDVKATDFTTRVVRSGSSVDAARPASAAARLAAANQRQQQQRVAVGGGVAP